VKIQAADWLPYRLPLRQPWQTHLGRIDVRHGELYRLTGSDGRTGWGDAAPLPEFGIDRQAARHFAEECARLDLMAQQAGETLHTWLGAETDCVSVAVNANLGSLLSCTPATTVAAQAAGFSVIKLKVGLAPLATEIAHLRRLTAALPTGLRFRLDANAAWPEDQALEFILACHDLPIESLEEPLAKPTALSLNTLQQQAAFALAIDESWHLIDDAFFASPCVQRLIIKPARIGGLLAALAFARTATLSNIDCIITSSLESACGILACAHLAAAVAPNACHGLATSDWLSENTGTTPLIENGRLILPKKNGLGFRANPSFSAAA
jgi:O-succinylbenzoate synthase